MRHPAKGSRARPNPDGAGVLARECSIAQSVRRGAIRGGHGSVELHLFGYFGGAATAGEPEPKTADQLSHEFFLNGLEHTVDSGDHALEVGALSGQLLAAGGGKRVIPSAAVIFGSAPFRGHPTIEQEALQRW